MVTCSGCHDLNNGGNPPEIHARSDGEAPSINAGVAASGQLVNTLIPGTVAPNPYLGTLGQTLAEVRFDRLASSPAPDPQLSADLVYDDYWTDPAVRTADVSYAYNYIDLDAAMTPPTNSFCSPGWAYNCRVTINYPEHIHAIFQLDRGVNTFTPLAPINPPTNDPTNTPLVPSRWTSSATIPVSPVTPPRAALVCRTGNLI